MRLFNPLQYLGAKGLRRLAGAIALTGTLMLGTSLVAAQEPQYGGTLTIALPGYPSAGLNPHNRGDSWPDTQVLRNQFDTLVVADYQEVFHPWLAESWTVSDDHLTWEFKLREGVEFHDGTPFNAEAVKVNFDLIVNPEYPAIGFGRSNYAGLTEVVALDEHNVRFVFAYPRADFLHSLSSVGSSIVAPSSLANRDNWSSGAGFVGTGPFVLESDVPGQELQFSKFEKYDWGPATATHQGPAYVDRLIVKFVPEDSVRSGLLHSREVQAVGNIPINDIPLFENADGFSYAEKGANVSPWSLFFNVTNGPTQDINVRRALQQGADLDLIVASVTQGRQQRPWYVIQPSGKYYRDVLEGAFGTDIELSNRLLDESGWTGRDSAGYRTNAAGERLVVRVVASQGSGFINFPLQDILRAYQGEIRKNVGIEVKLDFIDDATVKSILTANDYEAFPRSGGGSDPGILLAKTYGGTTIDSKSTEYRGVSLGGSINGTKLNDQEVNDALVDALQATSDEERADQFEKLARRLLIDLAASLPLYTDLHNAASLSSVHNIDRFFDAPRGLAIGWAYDLWIEKDAQ